MAADPPGHERTDDAVSLDWDELSELYRIAPLGVKPPDALRTVFGNSMLTTFARAGPVLVGAGRALAAGLASGILRPAP